MAKLQNQIEQIVREVLARMGEQAVEQPSAAGQLRLTSRVVSLSELEGRLQGMREVVVRSDAVVTPAARDLLRHGDILLSRSAKTSPETGCQLAIGCVETSYEAAGLVSHLEKGTTNVKQIEDGDLVGAVDALTKHITTSNQPALLLTEITTAGLCLANRRPSVRAAEVTTAANLSDAIDQVGVNLLVVNPRAITLTILCRVVERFCERWPIGCPSEYESYLN